MSKTIINYGGKILQMCVGNGLMPGLLADGDTVMDAFPRAPFSNAPAIDWSAVLPPAGPDILAPIRDYSRTAVMNSTSRREFIMVSLKTRLINHPRIYLFRVHASLMFPDFRPTAFFGPPAHSAFPSLCRRPSLPARLFMTHLYAFV